jgi:hypothetical protein
MKRSMLLGFIFFFALSLWAQETDSAPKGKFKVSGYIIGALTLNLTDSNAQPTDVFLDATGMGYRPDRTRLALSYTDTWGGMNALIDFNPFSSGQQVISGKSGTTTISSYYYPATGQNDLVKVTFAEAYLWLWPQVVKVGAGIVHNETDFGMHFQVFDNQAPGFFTGIVTPSGGTGVLGQNLPGSIGSQIFTTLDPVGGVYSGNWGGELLVHVPGVQGLELGAFLPLYATNWAGTGSAMEWDQNVQGALDLSDGVEKAVDFNLRYAVPGLGDLKTGWNPRRVTNSDNGGTLQNPLSTSGATEIYGSNVFYATLEFIPSFYPQLKTGIGYENHSTYDLQTFANNFYWTVGYDLRSLGLKDLWLGEDLAVGQADETKAGGYTNGPYKVGSTNYSASYFPMGFNPTETNVTQAATNSEIRYTFHNVLPDGYELVPSLRVRTYWENPVNGNPGSQGLIMAAGWEPKVQIVTPSGNVFGLGYGYYTGTLLSGKSSYSLVDAGIVIKY